MRAFRRSVIIAEIVLATHLGTLGEFWAASAAKRLKKLTRSSFDPEHLQ